MSDFCLELVREYERADREMAIAHGDDAEKLQIEVERAAYLLSRTEAASLQAAGSQIEIAARWLVGSIPDQVRDPLFRIASEVRSGDCCNIQTLRGIVELIEHLPTDVTPADFEVMSAEAKEDVLRMLRLALAAMTRMWEN